jgi:DnaK suppressor protein
MLTESKKKQFKKILNIQLEELLKSNDNTSRNIPEAEKDPLDFTDQASVESELDLNIHIKEREGRLIAKIQEALERLEDGSFGICEECGEPIAEKRLKARPVTALCINCKRKEEAEEKQRA